MIIDQDDLKRILFGSTSGNLIFYAGFILPCLPFLLKLTIQDEGTWGTILFEGAFNRYLWLGSCALVLFGGILYCLYFSFPEKCQQLGIQYSASIKNNLLFALLISYLWFLASSFFIVVIRNDLQVVIHTYIAPRTPYNAEAVVIEKGSWCLYSLRTRDVFCTNGLMLQVKIDGNVYLDKICSLSHEEYGKTRRGDKMILHGKKSIYGFSLMEYSRQESEP